MEFLNVMFWTILIVDIVIVVISIVLIVKFLNIARDVEAIKNKMYEPVADFKSEFYKWYLCGNTEKAKEVLTNEIGKSYEFQQLLRGGNPKYMEEMKEQLKNRYKKEIELVKVDLNLDCF